LKHFWGNRAAGLGTLLALAIGARVAAAATTTIPPGGQLVLDQDLVLAGADDFDAQCTAAAPCLIEGQGHGIRAPEGWQGKMIARHCTFHAVGSVDQAALRLEASGAGQIRIEDSVFDASGGVIITALEGVSVDILRNTVLETSLVPVPMDSSDNTVDAFRFQGFANTVEKHFQGNRIFRSRANFDSVQNWVVGGSNPGEGNIIVGLRAGVIANGMNIRIVGNYIRVPHDLDGWNQVKVLDLQQGPFLVEHNVLRDGNWLLDLRGDAEIRYNLLGDSRDRPWLILEVTPGAQKIHHNVFMRNNPRTEVDGAWVLRPASGAPAEVYNNTFYGGGACQRRTGPAVRVEFDAFLASLRSNAFVGFSNIGMNAGVVRGGGGDATSSAPERLGYADYNLFSNPRAAADNYALAVAGKSERVDPGFALNDAPAGGAVDSQVADPGFAAGAMIPILFPYSDDDIKAGTATVCQMLAYYRSVFAPAAGSALLGAGDPADGGGNNIGAVGGADDSFGKLCPSGDVGAPNLNAVTFTCPELPPPDPDPDPIPGGHGFVCVCEVAAAPSPGGGALALLAAGALLVRARRRTRRAD
jgi:MYXO-CTERM domain-containing protein